MERGKLQTSSEPFCCSTNQPSRLEKSVTTCHQETRSDSYTLGRTDRPVAQVTWLDDDLLGISAWALVMIFAVVVAWRCWPNRYDDDVDEGAGHTSAKSR